MQLPVVVEDEGVLLERLRQPDDADVAALHRFHHVVEGRRVGERTVVAPRHLLQERERDSREVSGV